MTHAERYAKRVEARKARDVSICEMYVGGKTIADVASVVGLTPPTVSKILATNGVRTRARTRMRFTKGQHGQVMGRRPTEYCAQASHDCEYFLQGSDGEWTEVALTPDFHLCRVHDARLALIDAQRRDKVRMKVAALEGSATVVDRAAA